MIIDLQRRLSEVGRIRIGQQVPIGSSGKTRPAKLDTFRLTSPDRQRIEHAARLFGGAAEEWTAPVGPQWQVITETDRLAVMVPPSDLAFSQWYELWSGAGCQRRCDGRIDSISEDACGCDPDSRECDVHTRLSVMLRDLVGLGLWRLDTQGWNAALELQGAVEIMQLAAGRGQMLPAQLRLEQRMQKRPGEQVRRFAVPVLDVEISPAQLLGSSATVTYEQRELPQNNGQDTAAASLTPVPESVPQWPTSSIAEQADATTQAEPKPKRRGAAKAVPKTNLAPRTAAQAREDRAAATVVEEEKAQAAQFDVYEAHMRGNAAFDEAQAVDEGVTAQKSGEGPAENGTPPPSSTPDDDVRMITGPQLKKLSILLREAGFDDREVRHAFVATAINREVDSAKDLTLAEARDVIDLLEHDRQTERSLPDDR